MAGSLRKEYKRPDREGARFVIDWEHTFGVMTDFVAIMDTQLSLFKRLCAGHSCNFYIDYHHSV